MQLPRLPEKKWAPDVWAQLKAITKKSIIGTIRRDDSDRWKETTTKNAPVTFYNPKLPQPFQHLSIHFHPTEGYRDEKLLRRILNQICWTEAWLIEHKVIKVKGKRKNPNK